MRGAALLSEIRCKGAIVTLAGGKLRAEAPPGVLTAELQAHLRSLAAELRGCPEQEIQALLTGPEESATPGEAQPQREHRGALKRALDEFGRRGSPRSSESLLAAAWFESKLERGWDASCGMAERDAQDWLHQLYSGGAECAEIQPNGRPVLRALPAPSWEAS